MDTATSERGAISLGRYVICDEIASGGMATVHFGRLLGDAGFTRTVAVKRLHPQYAKDPEFAVMFMDEARVTSRIRHPNVVTTLDVVAQDGELFVIMEYVHGEPLSRLIRAARKGERKKLPPRVVGAIMAGALHGLHAAHEAVDEHGNRLDVVHRDVSPHNILVGVDGVARVLDFGIAKAAGRSGSTREGEIKGKFAYMPPEQLHGELIDRRADIYAAGVVLWEALTGTRLFHGSGDVLDLQRLLASEAEPPSSRVSGIPSALDEVVMRALAYEPEGRFPTAREMAIAIEEAVPLAPPSEVSALVEQLAGASLGQRAHQITTMEATVVPGSAIRPKPKAGASFYVDTTLIMPGAPPKPVIDDEMTLPINVANMLNERPVDASGDPVLAQLLNEERITLPLAGPPHRFLPAEARPGEPGRIAPASRASTVKLYDPLTEAASRRRATVIAAAVVLLGLLIAALLGIRTLSGGAAVDLSEAAESGGPQPQAPDPGARADGLRATPSIDALPEATGSAPSPEPSPSVEPTGGTPGRSARPPARTRPAPKATASSCNPPFVIDAQGHKRYKRECL